MRKPILIIVLVLAVFLTIKFDLLTTAKISLENMFYNHEVQRISGFLIVVEVTNPEIECAGLTRKSIRKTMTDELVKSGVRVLTEELWQKTPDRPALHIWVNALPAEGQKGIYQYMLNFAVTKKDETNVQASLPQKDKVILSTSELGKNDVKAIQEDIIKLTDEFLKARAGR